VDEHTLARSEFISPPMERSEPEEEVQIYLGFDHLVFFPGHPVTGIFFIKLSKPTSFSRIGLNWYVSLPSFFDSRNRFGCEQIDWVEGLLQRDSRSVQNMLFQDKQTIFPDDCMSIALYCSLTHW
jgi:hypothetical protein